MTPSSDVGEVKSAAQSRQPRGAPLRRFRGGYRHVGRRGYRTSNGRSRDDPQQTCGRCGYTRHRYGEVCPAHDATCNRCHKKGHFKARCRTRMVKEVVACDEIVSEGDEYFLGNVDVDDTADTNTRDTKDWMVNLKVYGISHLRLMPVPMCQSFQSTYMIR